jgi:cell division protein ZapE
MDDKLLGPLPAYRRLVEDGAVRADTAQMNAVARLQTLADEIEPYAMQMGRSGWLARLQHRRLPTPRGVYLHGGVGRGKTMLMDLFYQYAAIENRKRIHFHAFMLEVHDRVHCFREAARAGKVRADADPLKALARVIVDQAWLLCFDEFHVSNIADAMILGRLFEALFEQGVVVVTTSNRPPADLYKGGLQRELFLPFIDLIERRLDVVELDSGIDYRLERMRSFDTYLTPLGPETDARLESAFADLIAGAEAKPWHVMVQGREVRFPRMADGVLFAGFADLCERPLGSADYAAIADRCHTVVLGGIPRLGPQRHNEAHRFVTLIDTLYEHKVNLVCSADAPPEALYAEGTGAFEFQRTVSRLIEMQSDDYISSWDDRG